MRLTNVFLGLLVIILLAGFVNATVMIGLDEPANYAVTTDTTPTFNFTANSSVNTTINAWIQTYNTSDWLTNITLVCVNNTVCMNDTFTLSVGFHNWRVIAEDGDGNVSSAARWVQIRSSGYNGSWIVIENDTRVEGDLNVTGSLTAAGTSSLDDLVASNLSVGGGYGSTGLFVWGDGNLSTNGASVIDGVSYLVDNVFFGGGYGSTGLTVFSNGNLSSDGNLTIDGVSALNDNVLVGGGYGSTGLSLFSNGNLSMDGVLVIDDSLDVANKINVTGGTGRLLLPQNNNATHPTVAFGDGDTGFYESSDDVLLIPIGGAIRWTMTTSGFGNYDLANSRLLYENPTSTNPNIVPKGADDDTGIGHSGEDNLSLITGGYEMMRLSNDTNTVYTNGNSLVGGGYGSTGLSLFSNGNLSMNGDLVVDGSITGISTIASDLIPSVNATYDLGNESHMWNKAHLIELFIQSPPAACPSGSYMTQTVGNETTCVAAVKTTGDTRMVGDYYINGSMVLRGNLTIIDSFVNATVSEQYLNGTFYPSITDVFDIGSSGLKWDEGFFNGALVSSSLDTGLGANELYFMSQDVGSSNATTFSTVNTGQGDNELYYMDQDVGSLNATTFATVDTGQGANELYDMDQNVLSSSNVTFDDVNSTNGDVCVTGGNCLSNVIEGGTSDAWVLAGENITSGTVAFARLPDLTNASVLNAANITAGTLGAGNYDLDGKLNMNLDVHNRLLLPIFSNQTHPTLGFGAGSDTGFYESSAGSLRITIEGTAKWLMDANQIGGSGAGGGFIKFDGVSATTPVVGIDRGDTDTGFGSAGANQLNLITGGYSFININNATNIMSVNGKLNMSADEHNRLLLPVFNNQTHPTIGFGNGDSGFFESSDDTIKVSIGGVATWFFDVDEIGANGAGGPALIFSGVSATKPSVQIDRGDTNTGLGTAGADQINLITGGYSFVNINNASNLMSVEGDLAVNNTVLYVNRSNERVGIGTGAPGNKLQVISTDVAVGSAWLSNDAAGSNKNYAYFGLQSANGDNRIYRDIASATTLGPVVHIGNDNAGDDQSPLLLTNDGTAPILDLDGAGNQSILWSNGARIDVNSTCLILFSPDGTGQTTVCNT